MYTIDRFEGNMVIIENRDTGEMLELPRSRFPKDCQEGDLFTMADREVQMLRRDTDEAQERIRNKMKALWK